MTLRATGLPIGDVSGYAKRFCNVFNAEDCKLQLVEFPIAHVCGIIANSPQSRLRRLSKLIRKWYNYRE